MTWHRKLSFCNEYSEGKTALSRHWLGVPALTRRVAFLMCLHVSSTILFYFILVAAVYTFQTFFQGKTFFSLDVLFPTKHLLFSLTYIPIAARPTQIIFLLSDTNQTHEYFRVHIFSRVGRLSLFPSQFFWLSGYSSSTKDPCWGRAEICPDTWHGTMMVLTFWSIFRHITPLTHEKAEQPFITLCSSMRHHREWRELWCQKELASHLGCCFTPMGILDKLFPFSETCVFISIICWDLIYVLISKNNSIKAGTETLSSFWD